MVAAPQNLNIAPTSCPLQNIMGRYANSSYLALIFVMTIIILLNVNQLQLLNMTSIPDGSSTLLWNAMSLDFAMTSKSIPDYFSSPIRLRKPLPSRKKSIQKHLVKPGDYVYYKDEGRWDAAPIVVEQYKLLFFSLPKAGCTVWKQLFRRMAGIDNWHIQDETTFVPHNPDFNGLKYLYDYSLEQASEMMTSPEWTRAIMVRDPKQRFLSAFLDKAISNDHKHIRDRCCPDDRSCIDGAQSIEGFLSLCAVCEDDHWRPQHHRMESKYWPYIDHVLNVESADRDAKALLQKIGAWEEYGKSGWGESGNLAIFQSKDVAGAGEHATWAQWQVWKWYTPEIEVMVEQFYQCDYDNPVLNFTRAVCLTCS
jgi:Sulfotransferase family